MHVAVSRLVLNNKTCRASDVLGPDDDKTGNSHYINADLSLRLVRFWHQALK